MFQTIYGMVEWISNTNRLLELSNAVHDTDSLDSIQPHNQLSEPDIPFIGAQRIGSNRRV
jgi:hypothetical protein